MSEPVKALNLMTNPKPTGTRGWTQFGNVEVRMATDGTSIFCRNISGGGEAVASTTRCPTWPPASGCTGS